MSTENKLVDEKPATLAEHIQLIKDTTKQAAIVPHAWLDEWLKEAERQEQTIADLRARVEAMQKAGGAMRDKLAQLRMRQYQMMSQWAEASEEKKKELWSRLHERTDQYLDAIETWDAACSVTTNIAEHVRVKVPVVTHINMDPNASAETKQAVGDMIRAAYDYKPSAPAQPLSVDKIMEVYHEHEQWFNLHGGTPAKRSGNFKARLNKLIG